jgi:peptidyl-prolyl cis-trans isomerase SurA
MFALALVFSITQLASVARAQLVEAVVAFVDDEPLFWSDLSRRLQEQPATEGEEQATRARQMLDRMIDEVLIRREAERLSVVVVEADVERAIAAVRAQSGLDERGFEQALRAQHYDAARYREELRMQIRRMKVLQLRVGPIQIAEEELRQVWRERVIGVPESDRLPFTDARDALYRELMNARATEAQERAMRALRDAAYIERRIEGR